MALLGETGQRLGRWCGQARGQLDADTVNLFDAPTRWSQRVAGARFRELRTSGMLDHRPVVLLGARVCRAAGVTASPLCWRLDSALRSWYLHVPHPSGRNRYWNDASHVAEVEAILQRLFGREAPPRDGRLI